MTCSTCETFYIPPPTPQDSALENPAQCNLALAVPNGQESAAGLFSSSLRRSGKPGPAQSRAQRGFIITSVRWEQQEPFTSFKAGASLSAQNSV